MIKPMIKDYFSEKEAADYCCVCTDKFRQIAKEYDLGYGNFGKKKLYRKVDLQRLIEQEAFKNGQRFSA